MKSNLITTKLNSKEQLKTKQDINFLRKLKQFSLEKSFRLVLSGGYGLDAILGAITRPHNDIDAIIYGQFSRKKAQSAITKLIHQLFPLSTVAVHENDFMLALDINSPRFGANLYYVETDNDPYRDINTLILRSGRKHSNDSRQFLPPVMGNLSGTQFESQNPTFHLADILSKRQNNQQAKHEQDILNLKKLLSQQ